MVLDCLHLFPTACAVTSYWEFESGHGGNVDTMEVSKYYKSGYPSHSLHPVIIEL